MDTELNKLQCGSDKKNTGFGDCPLDMQFVKKALKVPTGIAFTAAEILAIEATLRTGILAPKAQRIYPFPTFVQITDNSEEAQVITYGYGAKAFGREGVNDWTFQFLDGALCVSKNLKTHDGPGDYLFVDADGKIFGTKVGDTLKGVPCLMKTIKPKVNDGTNPTVYSVRFIFDPNYIWGNVGFIDRVDGFDPFSLEGLQDIVLTKAAGGTTTAVKLTVTTGCDKLDLGTVFLDELTEETNWVGTALVGGASVTPTAVAYVAGVNGAAGVFTVTFAAAVSAVTLVGAAALDAAGISGFEALTLSPVV